MREDVVFRRIDDLQPQRLVEIGCGGGEMLATLSERGYSGVGYDLSEVARAHARRRLTRIPQARFEVSDTWPSTERFDLVLLLEVLGYAPDPAALLRECRELLRPGGSLLVTFVRPGAGYDPIVVQGMKLMSPAEVRTALHAAGFAHMRFENYGFPLANALVGVMNRVHRARMAREQGLDTATETGLYHDSPWFKPLDLLSNRWTLKPFMYAQRLFANTELGNGFLASASTT